MTVAPNSRGLRTAEPYTACEREPIHRPESVQPHGVLLALDAHSLRVTAASANAGALLGADAAALLGRAVDDALGPDAAARLRDALARPRPEDANPMLVEAPAAGGPAPWEMLCHRAAGAVLVEVEPRDAAQEAGLAGLYPSLREAMTRLQGAGSVAALCDLAAAEVRRLAGYDRVMVYRFDRDWHGVVVAEAREPALEPFLGLHYPASDIPAQARRLYRRNLLRVVATADYAPAALVRAPAPGGGPPAPLDMSDCALRSVSPVHRQYLRNMGVTATMTISLVCDGALWGLIACHHHAPRRPSHQVRAACELLGRLAALQIRALEAREHGEYALRLAREGARLVTAMSAGETLVAGARAAGDALLALGAADGAVLRVDGQTLTLGRPPAPAAVAALVGRALTLGEDADGRPAPLVSDAVGERWPELAPAAEAASGALVLPLGTGADDYAAWFRGELVETVTWGGEPAKVADGETLTPRASFARWRQEVRGRSRPWHPGEVAAVQAFARAVPELLLQRAQARLAHLAMHDPLTGLANRDRLRARAEDALGRPAGAAGAAGATGVAVLVLDLDNFQQVNDTLGHSAGDALLVAVAERLRVATRGCDTVARLGGDEFAVVLADVDHDDEAVVVAERILRAMRAPVQVGGRELVCAVSIGIARATPGEPVESVLRNADLAMYAAKRGGRGRYAVFESSMHASLVERVQLAGDLRRAVAHPDSGELTVVYQPIVAVGTGDAFGAEALLRWRHPERGLVAPGAFIPLAEEAGLIQALGAWVLAEACRQGAQMAAARPPGARPFVLTVNVSERQLHDPAFPEQVAAALAGAGLAPESLVLELTESVLMQDVGAALPRLHAVKALGVRLALDDFGTGYSSLSYLQRLPLDVLKVDRAFVDGVADGGRGAAFAEAILRLGTALGLGVIAEGVETPEQLAALRALGCDSAQGYHFARPLPAAAAREFVARGGAGDLTRAA